MFKRLVNECTIELTLHPQGAMLIKSGLAQMSGIDMAWVRVYRNGSSEVYLPGSSLKGTIRSHAERIARTNKDKAACNPFGSFRDKELACGEILDRNQRKGLFQATMQDAYKNSCPICRMFGNTQMMGRLATEDAYVTGDPPETQQRDGVGIDRFTGGASRGAKFELEVITEGAFKTTLHLQNFELWQLGLLGFVLHDLKDGLVRMGSGKSRGMGKVTASIGKITLSYLGAKNKIAQNGHISILGAGALYEPAQAEYGMQGNDAVQIDKANIEIPQNALPGLRQTAIFSFDNFPWAELAQRWNDYVGTFIDPLEKYRGGTDGK